MKKVFYCCTAILLAFLVSTAPALHAQPGMAKAGNITIAYESFGDSSNETIILIQGTGATLLHYPAALCQKLADRHSFSQSGRTLTLTCMASSTRES